MPRRRGELRLQPDGQPPAFPAATAALPLRFAMPGRGPTRGRSGIAEGNSVNGSLIHEDVDAASATGVRNSQPEGIGRVVALDDLVCWNNLGRNVVFADRRLRPRAIFGTTLFPDEDEASQYDFDVHSIL